MTQSSWLLSAIWSPRDYFYPISNIHIYSLIKGQWFRTLSSNQFFRCKYKRFSTSNECPFCVFLNVPTYSTYMQNNPNFWNLQSYCVERSSTRCLFHKPWNIFHIMLTSSTTPRRLRNGIYNKIQYNKTKRGRLFYHASGFTGTGRKTHRVSDALVLLTRKTHI